MLKYQVQMKSLFVKLFNRQSTKGKMARGGIWLSSGNAVEQSLRFARNIILARLLAPDALGIMTIIISVNHGLEAFTQVGIREAVIQNPDSHKTDLQNMAWWISACRALILLIIGVFATPLLVKFYSISFSPLLLQISFLNIFFSGLISPKAFVSLKEMNFGNWVIISQGGAILGILCAIILTFYLRSPWALIIGFVCEAGFKVIMSFIIYPFLPKLKFAKEQFNALMKFSKGMAGLPLLTFAYQSIDMFVVGKLFTMYEVGLYGMARSLARTPNLLISMLIGPMLMPLLSKHVANHKELNRIILRLTTLLAMVCSPLIFLFAYYGDNILHLVYGTEYIAVSNAFAIIFSATILQICSTPIATAFMAAGIPQEHRLFTGIRAVCMILLIVPATMALGLNGAALAGLLAMTIAYLFQGKKIHSITKLDLLVYFKAVAGPFLVSMIILTTSLIISNYVKFFIYRLTIGITFCLIPWFLFLLHQSKKEGFGIMKTSAVGK